VGFYGVLAPEENLNKTRRFAPGRTLLKPTPLVDHPIEGKGNPCLSANRLRPATQTFRGFLWGFTGCSHLRKTSTKPGASRRAIHKAWIFGTVSILHEKTAGAEYPPRASAAQNQYSPAKA
jgi:hypothetical protein